MYYALLEEFIITVLEIVPEPPPTHTHTHSVQLVTMHCTCKVGSKYEYKIIIPNLDENVEGAKLQIT